MSAAPSVFVIGAGPVATALAGRLQLAGLRVRGLWGRNPVAVTEAARLAQVTGYSSELPDVVLDAELLVLAVRDDAIADVAGMLLAAGLLRGHHVLLHCSGALSSGDAFASVASDVGGCGLLHPLRALASQQRLPVLAGTTFGIEGDAAGRAAAQLLCTALGGEFLMLESEQMASYHAAASMASNYVVALLDAASHLLQSAGVDAVQVRAALCSLASGAIDNVGERGLPAALTGPIRRGDRQTVARHLHALETRSPDLGRLYRAMGIWTVEMSRRCGDAANNDLAEIADLFRDASKEGQSGSGA